MDSVYRHPIPPQLKEIPQPPAELYARGRLLADDEIFLTVVGARKHSSYGKSVCEYLLKGLSGYPITIVSGLALGIDALAHQYALEAGLCTVAVPGSGISDAVLYPRSNLQLAHKILEHGGTLLSEHEPDFKATVWSFPERNRIMAGLAKATLVIEANAHSGTLITARLATEYNRDVFAVPGDIFNQLSQGPNLLISQGATPISSPEDLIIALGLKTKEEARLPLDLSEFLPHERAILELLNESKEKHILLQELDLPITEAQAALMKLELRGIIRDEFGLVRRLY